MTHCGNTADMFDINGDDKLAAETVQAREAIVRYYAQHPKSLFVISDSSGKDSQAMKLRILDLVPHNKIIVVHADLGDEIEHDGVQQHIRDNTPSHIPIEVVQNEKRNLLDAALQRGKWFSARARYCTSDHKTGPIDKLIRRISKERGAEVVFNCTGLRAEESRARSMKFPLWINKRLTIKTRTVYDFMPIFHYSTDMVYDAIEAAGQKPHPAYGNRGDKNHRLSCVLCVLANKNDLVNGARNYPEKYQTYVALERVIDHTMFTRKKQGQTIKVTLVEKTGVPIDELAVQRKVTQLKARQHALLKVKADEQKAKANKAKTPAQKTPVSDVDNLDLFG